MAVTINLKTTDHLTLIVRVASSSNHWIKTLDNPKKKNHCIKSKKGGLHANSNSHKSKVLNHAILVLSTSHPNKFFNLY
jgi:hypothetical protein